MPKPLDFGGDGINGSVDARGRLIALNFYHPDHGYVTLTSADPFPEDARYDPPKVRAYRAALARLEGFGLHADRPLEATSAIDDGAAVHQRFGAGDATCELITFVSDGIAIQRWNGQQCAFTFDGTYRLMRCAYTQLTEGGPLPMPPIETQTHQHSDLLLIENPAIGAVAIRGVPQQPASSGELRFAFGLTAGEALAALEMAEPNLDWQMQRWARWWDGVADDPLLRRGLAYSYRMSVPVGEGICLLTDHMLLPLSWNRDAYYLARALLSWHPDMRDVVRRHLIWMFEIADRVDGAWARCYLANGHVKDPAFQLDQQLFPLLQLAEYVTETGDQATLERLRSRLTDVIDMLMRRKADHAALFPTDETPADDPIAQPYHLSSHILFWAALHKLSHVGMDYTTLADAIRDAVKTHFITEHDGKPLYAYATDGQGGFHLYHDANDFPTVLAPVWGFCDIADPVWRSTLAYAFSDANHEGVYNGRLGSVHTRAPWALGDVQDLIIARLLADPDREAHAKEHLQFAAQHDGALPEAYDAQTGEVASRTWFAWPSAAYACAELNAFAP